jgi:antitoxin component YwqK of YwqJK toxin-antitoxin module
LGLGVKASNPKAAKNPSFFRRRKIQAMFRALRSRASIRVVIHFLNRSTMQKRSFLPLIFFLSLLLSACSNRETVEQKSEAGVLERYERLKKDGRKDGLYQKFWPNGKVQVEAHYKADSLDGERRFYYETGAVQAVEHYVNNHYHGDFKEFYPNGKAKVEQRYENDKLQGISTVYYENGNVREQVTLKDNEEDGPFKEYYENGNLKCEGTYSPSDENGMAIEQGELKEYDETGQLARIAQCVNGVCNTVWRKN